MAAERKAEKYHNLSSDHIYQPITMENLGAFTSSSLEFLRELGRRLGSLSGEEREACFLSSTCLLQYDLIRCFCTMASLMTFQTSSYFSCFYPFCF